MTILKSIQTGNGLTLAHRILKAEIVGPLLQLQVHMYPSAEDAQADSNLRWQEYPSVPLASLDITDATGSMERALAAQAEGLFAGATVVAAAAPDDLELARARKWAEIKGERDLIESGGFDMPGLGRFDRDSESRNRIVGAVTAAKIAQDAAQPYVINWTLADNSTVELDAPAMISVGFTLLAHMDATHQRSRALYAEIQAAQDSEALAAIRWEPVQTEAGPEPETQEPAPE